MSEPKRTEPTQHLYRGASYTPAANTDVAKTWAKFRARVVDTETPDESIAEVITALSTENLS